MISTARLVESLDGDWIAFDKFGDPVQASIPPDIGPAALLVAPVTDAVKRVEDDIVQSMDRNQMWLVEAIVLNRVVLRRLQADALTVEELLQVVRDMGYSWQISPISSP